MPNLVDKPKFRWIKTQRGGVTHWVVEGRSPEIRAWWDRSIQLWIVTMHEPGTDYQIGAAEYCPNREGLSMAAHTLIANEPKPT